MDKFKKRPCLIHIDLDLLQLLSFTLAFISRFWKLEFPRAIVFDELHYGHYAAMYLNRTFFFDSHPPLGKMLLGFSAYLSEWDADFKFEHIGAAYAPSVPVWSLRFLPALFSSLTVPIVYQIAIDIGLSSKAAFLASMFVVLDNAMITQSRFIFMEGFLLFFISMAVLALLRFTKINKESPFCTSWFIWMSFIGVAASFAFCTKYIGLMTYLLCVWIVIKDLWNMLPDKKLTDLDLFKHTIARGASLFVVPILLYISVFYIHLSILNRAGPHDDVMTSSFQASLEGGLAAITKGQPLEVVHGSQITLRHTYGKPCWLHSHNHVYPLRYQDGRGSSHQQQVTCYSYKDINNWWIIKKPEQSSLMVDDTLQPIKHGDIVQLIHGMSSRALNSHDVAAPMSPQYQEVTCYIDYNISAPSYNLWKVDIVNREAEGETWKTIKSQVRLIHVNSLQVLKTSGLQLGEWGFFQYEVVTDRLMDAEAAVWNVEEHRYTKTESQEATEKDLYQAELIPLQPVKLSFWSKFYELQLKMLQSLYESLKEHRYSSTPLDWPFLETNVAYWKDSKTSCQVHLLGNPVLWITGSVVCVLYAGLLIIYILRRARKCYDIDEVLWDDFVAAGEIFAVGYVLHFLPFFLTDQLLFLHHYLPALLFQFLMTAAMIEHIHNILYKYPIYQHVYDMLVLVWITSVVYTSWIFQPFTYGYPCLNTVDIKQREWTDLWDFFHS